MEKTGENRENVKALVWYVLCFLVLGLIDQRRGSAGGTTQLTMVNLLGLVVAALLLPSLDKAFLRFRGMWIWTGFSLVLGPVICVLGSKWWYYPGQWCTGVLNVVLAGYLVLYVIWKRQEIRSRNRVHMGWFLVIMVMLVLMQLSVHEALWPGWFAVMFGSFYLIGIPEKLEGVFCKGFCWG